MTAQAENTRRIAKNTLMLYVRMLFGMLVSLYTSRVVLRALGVEDYGIYNVVGGMVAMFSMVSASLSSSVSRFLTFELGKGNEEGLRRIFSTSLSIHLVLSGVIVLLAETVGVWFLNTRMTIPPARIEAANWVLQASILTFVFNLWSVPFIASIISHERMSAFAGIGILDIILRLFSVLFVAWTGWSFDRLIVYALLLCSERCWRTPSGMSTCHVRITDGCTKPEFASSSTSSHWPACTESGRWSVPDGFWNRGSTTLQAPISTARLSVTASAVSGCRGKSVRH